MSDAIRFDHVSKQFIMHREKPRSFQDLVVDTLHRRGSQSEAFWALHDVSFAIGKGEMIGLIGPNGAGKSTILKLITRILEPTAGIVSVSGRVAALLELGTGFHPDLTGRENVFLNGSLLGFTRRQMDERLDGIVDFAGLQRFIDVPVRHYSSGMYMRLGFAIAVHADPDILITDEVLAVGDEAFQNKCLERMTHFRNDGTTIILVSHSLPTVRKLCDRVIWLKQGVVAMDGMPGGVVDAYIADVAVNGHKDRDNEPIVHISRIAHTVSQGDLTGVALGGEPQQDGAEIVNIGEETSAGVEPNVSLLDVEMIGPDGQVRSEMNAGEKMTVRLHYQAKTEIAGPVVALIAKDAGDQSTVMSYNSSTEHVSLTLPEGDGSINFSGLALPLCNGSYVLAAALFRQPDPPAWAHPDAVHQGQPFSVHSAFCSPKRRWGTGEAMIERVRICDGSGEEQTSFSVGAPMRLVLRCIKTGAPVSNPVLRVQIFDSNGVLCYATNSERTGFKLGDLSKPRDVTLVIDSLNLLGGEYSLSVGLWPSETSYRPYDWHDRAYRISVRSTYRDGAGLAALKHHWVGGD